MTIAKAAPGGNDGFLESGLAHSQDLKNGRLAGEGGKGAATDDNGPFAQQDKSGAIEF